ncbi:glycosyltransferase family 9 protein, partial [Burkholderia pseudomallei]
FHTNSIPLSPRTHAVARGRLVAGAALGYAVDYPPDFGLPAPQASTRPSFLPPEDYAVFFHGTARDAKKWPREHWVALG